MAILAAARRASSLLLLRASCALLRPLASPATAIRSSSASLVDSAKFALLKAASDSIHAETGSSASAATLDSLRAAADSLGTTTYNDLLRRDIDSAVKSSERPYLTKMKEAEGFSPFEITQDKWGNSSFDRDVTLQRTFEGEEINIRAYTISSYLNITLCVTVSKSNGSELKFLCTVYVYPFPNDIFITSLTMAPEQAETYGISKYDGFGKLDRNLQKSFYKYLERRGITARMGKLLCKYMEGGGDRMHHLWLKNLSDFYKKD